MEELVSQLRLASSTEASLYVEEIIRRFEPLLRAAWPRVALIVEYRDFVQEVFSRLFEGLPALRTAKAFPGYFRKIVFSVASSLARRSSSVHEVHVEEPNELPWVGGEAFTLRIFVRSYLELLPRQEREVIRLLFLEELPTSEASERLGIEPGAVRMTKSRALRRLRELWLREALALEAKR